MATNAFFKKLSLIFPGLFSRQIKIKTCFKTEVSGSIISKPIFGFGYVTTQTLNSHAVEHDINQNQSILHVISPTDPMWFHHVLVINKGKVFVKQVFNNNRGNDAKLPSVNKLTTNVL